MLTFEEFREYIYEKVGLYLEPSSNFFDEIGITDTDAGSLMSEIERDFNIDLSNFNEDIYIPTANWSPSRILFNRRKYKAFTTLHLVNVINKGKWFDPSN